MNGDEVLMRIKRYDSPISVIRLLAQIDTKTVVKYIKLGAEDYFPKPYNN